MYADLGHFVIVFLFLGVSIFNLTYITGAIELDLHHLINPSKTPEKCSLSMVPDGTTPPKSDQFKSLFDQKSVRGWWPCYMDKDGKRELGVSPAFIMYFFTVQYDISLFMIQSDGYNQTFSTLNTCHLQTCDILVKWVANVI